MSRQHSNSGRNSRRDQNREGLVDPCAFRGDDRAEAEFWVLSTPEGGQLLEELGDARNVSPAQLSRLRKLAPAEAVSAAVRLAQARRRAAIKFERGASMWVDPIGVEQATAGVVARHKARRFRAGLVVDLCAGIGSDTLALAANSNVLAVDRDQAMCRRIGYNAQVHGISERVLPIRCRAEQFLIPEGAWLHLDPDRRAKGSRRATRVEDYSPDPKFWSSVMGQVAAGAIKLSPAADFAHHFAANVEVELISLRGECKEATVWFGELVTCQRRATRLPENVTWTDRDNPGERRTPVTAPKSFIYDPDPSLLRAGLLDGFAQAHQLGRVAGGVDYLTSGHLVASPFLSAFELLEVSSLDLKALNRLSAKHQVGTLDIKVRGVDMTPEALRPKLKLAGAHAATLLLLRGPGTASAILAQRVSTGGLATSSGEGELAIRSAAREAEASPLPVMAAASSGSGSCGAAEPLPTSPG